MTIKAWHFVGGKLRNGDPVPLDGEWLEYKGVLVMCRSGLHASIDPFDALQYAPGPILCRVECAGDVIKDTDKLVCTRRKIIARRDATDGLRYFARMQALSVAHLWDCPDVVLDWLMTGDEASREAAQEASRAASREAWEASREAAREAARVASQEAREAAWAASQEARDASQEAAWAARVASQEASRAAWAELVAEAFDGVD